jgi:two-component system, response regulator YesN
MYNILVVDDEPLICKGLSQLLSTSGLDIGSVFIACSGYEALDYIRIEDIHLLVTDIQMGGMNGIELMNQAKIIKPWIETIVISAHETFQYAQMAIRLGAKDYMIKPLKNERFLDSVRSVLLSLARPAISDNDLLSSMQEHFQMKNPDPERNQWLNDLLTVGTQSVSNYRAGFEADLIGPYYAVIRIRLLLTDVSDKDMELFRYAALNIVNELLDHNWHHDAFYSGISEIGIVMQWSEEQYADSSINKIHELEMVGRSLNFNIHKYLRIRSVAGISQILKGGDFLPVLGAQAQKALQWNRNHQDHYVFYYGDFKWNLQDSGTSEDEWLSQNNLIVQKAKEYVDAFYSNKGMTLNEVAQKCHVSPNYLSYLFKKYMRCNLWEYVVKLRMEESKRLIMTTGMRSYEVADRVGYESSEHFSKSFKRYFGVNPTELKK